MALFFQPCPTYFDPDDSPRTEESYVAWVKRYVRFHGLRHPDELGVQDVTRFLSALAESGRLSASSQTRCSLVSMTPRASQPC